MISHKLYSNIGIDAHHSIMQFILYKKKLALHYIRRGNCNNVLNNKGEFIDKKINSSRFSMVAFAVA